MTERQINALARRLAAHLTSLHEGDHDNPQTWVPVAPHLPCRLHGYHMPGGAEGDYAPASHPEGWGVIQYNTALTPPAQARVIVHEMAHHLLMPLVPGYVLGEYVTCRYDDDPLDVRHRIARQVEHICFKK